MIFMPETQVDFSGGKNGHRAKQAPGSEQVVKAAALSKRRNISSNLTSEEVITRELGGYDPELPLLWDLTAGLGTDAFVLALAGWRVKMFERSPIVAALVKVRCWNGKGWRKDIIREILYKDLERSRPTVGLRAVHLSGTRALHFSSG